MSVSLWVFWIISALILGAFSTLIWGNIQNKKGYKEGYSNGYQKGANDQYNGDFKKRLLKQSRRAAAKEKNTQPASNEQDDLLNLGVKDENDRSSGEETTT